MSWSVSCTNQRISYIFITHFQRRASGEVNNDIVVEMKTDKANEEAGLLNKRPPTEQVTMACVIHML